MNKAKELKKMLKIAEKPSKNIYLICEDNAYEKTVCAEYVKVRKLTVIHSAHPHDEKEKQEIAKHAIAEAKKGTVDTVVVYDPDNLSSSVDMAALIMKAIFDAGVKVNVACACVFELFDEERQENELKPLLQELIESEEQE